MRCASSTCRRCESCCHGRVARRSRASWPRASTPRRSAPHRARRRCARARGQRRPGARAGGSWTATGWPATLESAVLSGHAAARTVRSALECGMRARMTWSASASVLVAAPLRLEEALICSAARGARVRKTGMGPEKSRAAAERAARGAGPGADRARLLRRPGRAVAPWRSDRRRARCWRAPTKATTGARGLSRRRAARRRSARCRPDGAPRADRVRRARSPSASAARSCARRARSPSTWSRCGSPRAPRAAVRGRARGARQPQPRAVSRAGGRWALMRAAQALRRAGGRALHELGPEG